MTTEFKIVEEPKKPLSMHPKKFAMWLFLATVGMLFAAFTSAYIVRQAEGNWVFFELPNIFYYTTVVILLSTVTMQWAYSSVRKNNLSRASWLVTITAVFGLMFLIGQFLGWADLVRINVRVVGNPSGSFVYLLTAVHGVHIISAIIFLLFVLNSVLRKRAHPGNMAQMEMCTTYWHFLSGLWLYLFGFLLLYR